MDIKKEMTINYILMKKMRKRSEELKPQQEWVERTFQGREKKSYTNVCNFHYYC